MIIETILIIIAVIVLLVVSHELGHFFVAKWFGIRVEEFGIGFPVPVKGLRSPALSKQFGETLYSIYLIPFGGFVRIFGEEEDSNDPRSFSSQSFFRKIVIVAAGVIANVITAYFIFTMLAWLGTPKYGIRVQDIAPDSPAAIAGFQKGDIIAGIGSEATLPSTTDEVRNYIEGHKGMEAIFTLYRDPATITLTAIPRANPPPGQGALGIAMIEEGLKPVPWYRAPWEGLRITWFALKNLFLGLVYLVWQLVSTGTTPGEVIGPVGIAAIAGETFKIGLFWFLQLVALLSLNLAIINILPIPALDGGRILFFIIEKIRGKPIPVRVANAIHSVFFLILIFFLVWVTHRDIANWDRYLETFRAVQH